VKIIRAFFVGCVAGLVGGYWFRGFMQVTWQLCMDCHKAMSDRDVRKAEASRRVSWEEITATHLTPEEARDLLARHATYAT
jgi:hypothetical protein